MKLELDATVLPTLANKCYIVGEAKPRFVSHLSVPSNPIKTAGIV
jgi:hypothetical protein